MKKVYVGPTIMERNVRVSMICLSHEDPTYGARSNTFTQGEGIFNEDNGFLKGIDVSNDNDDIWSGID